MKKIIKIFKEKNMIMNERLFSSEIQFERKKQNNLNYENNIQIRILLLLIEYVKIVKMTEMTMLMLEICFLGFLFNLVQYA